LLSEDTNRDLHVKWGIDPVVTDAAPYLGPLKNVLSTMKGEGVVVAYASYVLEALPLGGGLLLRQLSLDVARGLDDAGDKDRAFCLALSRGLTDFLASFTLVSALYFFL
jgi:hypothetical protein